MDTIKLYIINTDIFINNEIFDSNYRLLDASRQAKIDRLKFDADKRRSLGAGYLLKRALDDLKLVEDARELTTETNGKPYLTRHPEIKFNLSHSGHYAILAINDRGLELGCDIEAINDKKNLAGIIKRVLTKNETTLIEPKQADQAEYLKSFYDIWTAKESYVKLTGKGLGSDFSQLEIRPEPDGTRIYDIKSNDYKYIKRQELIDGYSISLCLPVNDINISVVFALSPVEDSVTEVVVTP